jgi:hypothetical protein
MVFQRRVKAGILIVGLTLLDISGVRALGVSLQKSTARPTETTITELVKSSARFSEKLVRVFASFHTDGFENSVLMEPNCGLRDGTSKTPPPGQPQCARGVVPYDSDKADHDPGNKNLDRALSQGERGTGDKHITAEFIGRFRCIPSCVSAKRFTLELQRVEKLEVVMKDMRPHRPARIALEGSASRSSRIDARR